MLKHNALKGASAAVFAVAAALFFVIVVSCKSAPAAKEAEIDPVALVDTNASFYFYMPVKANAEFAKKVLCKKIEGLSEKDAESIVNHTKTIVIASGIQNNNSAFQIATSGSYPLIAVQASLTESNGWRKKISADSACPYTYYVQKGTMMQLSVPSSNSALVSEDIQPMMQKYQNSMLMQSSPEAEYKNAPDGWDEKTYDFLTCGKPGEIKFIAFNPASFVAGFLKKDIKLGIQSISGTMTQNAKSGIFNLELNVEVTDSRTIKAALSMLKIALFPIPAEIVQVDENHIKITSITITWDGLTDLLVR